ncbi:MAG: DnaJ domain-containing protein, partial [bacterium]
MAKQNHYLVLGVGQKATAEEIRRRYRQLARRYHPDVNKSPDSTRRFQRINEAYEVLSDPDRRNNYDAVLGFSQQPKPASPKPKTPPNPPTQEKPKPTQTASRPQPRPKQTTTSDEIKQIMLQAERAFTQNRFREAMDKAYIVTQRQPRNASAYALLGDIYRMDG